jgi:predicted alpha/beta hydrolase family esterase
MKKVLLIHGFTGNGNGVWFPWMKCELESRGYGVFTPSMPEACHPDLQKWVDALEPYYRLLDEHDVIVAHSLGSKAALHTILRVRKKIGRLILVASPIGEYRYRDWEKRIREKPNEDQRAVQRFWECHLPIEEISHFTKVTLIVSDDDTATPLLKFDNIPDDWKKQIWHGCGHFCQSALPALLGEIVRGEL